MSNIHFKVAHVNFKPLLLIIAYILPLFLHTPCFADEINWDRFITSVIQVESNGIPNAVSSTGAIGLMQITPIAFKEYQDNLPPPPFTDYPAGYWNFDNMFNPNSNKEVGTWYLKRLHNHYGCDTVEKILMSYNYGITRCKRIDFDLSKTCEETKNYVRKVLKLYEKPTEEEKNYTIRNDKKRPTQFKETL